MNLLLCTRVIHVTSVIQRYTLEQGSKLVAIKKPENLTQPAKKAEAVKCRTFYGNLRRIPLALWFYCNFFRISWTPKKPEMPDNFEPCIRGVQSSKYRPLYTEPDVKFSQLDLTRNTFLHTTRTRDWDVYKEARTKLDIIQKIEE